VLAAVLLLLTEFSVHRGATTVAISPAKASATVIVFVSTLCPISDKYVDRLNDLHRRFSANGVQFVMAFPNANESWDDIESYSKRNGLDYPVYKDEANQLADRLDARSTPEAFVFDRSGQLRYRGRIDDAANPARVRAHSLRDAIESVLHGRAVLEPQTPALGCSIHRVKN
jgi:hypothetical protein